MGCEKRVHVCSVAIQAILIILITVVLEAGEGVGDLGFSV